MNSNKSLELKQASGVSINTGSDAEALIAKAIENNVPVETMERLLAMRRELKAERAKEEFDKAMAAFQANCPTIRKTKSVSFNTTHYSYAPLEDIVEQVKELLASNGFSYTFDTKENENAIILYCKVKHEAGHMETSEVKIEIDQGAKMNVSQKYGSAMTYGKRYAFCNAFGILTGDEDNDANYHHAAKPKTGESDSTTSGGDYERQSNGHKATEKQINFIHSLLKQKGYTEKQLEQKYEVSKLEELTADQASTIIGNLQKLPAKK